MSDSNDRSPSAPETAQTEGHGESLFDRLKSVLGLKAPSSIRELVPRMSSRGTIAARKGRRSKSETRNPTRSARGTIDLSSTLGAVKSLVRNVLFVPPSMPAIDLMAKMQATRTQLALVIDEY